MSDQRLAGPRGAIHGANRKVGRYAGAAAVASHLVRSMVDASEKLALFVMTRSPGTTRELARRNRARPSHRDRSRWFTPDESALVNALANLIVPSDDTGPGVAEMRDPSVAEALDELVAGSERRQNLYGRGLLDVDRLARHTYQSDFVDLPQEHQVRLLRLVDRLNDKSSTPASLAAKIRTRLVVLYRKSTRPAIAFFPMLVEDVLRVFYTNRVSWDWLGYDGPPMPEGYRHPLVRRSPVRDDTHAGRSAAS